MFLPPVSPPLEASRLGKSFLRTPLPPKLIGVVSFILFLRFDRVVLTRLSTLSTRALAALLSGFCRLSWVG